MFLAVAISVLGSSLLRSTEMSSVSVGASFPPSEGKRNSLSETIYLALKMQTVRSALQRHLYQSQVSGAVCDHEESEMECWTQTALNWARIAVFACPSPSHSHQKSEGLQLREKCWNFSGGANAALSFSPLLAYMSNLWRVSAGIYFLTVFFCSSISLNKAVVV